MRTGGQWLDMTVVELRGSSLTARLSTRDNQLVIELDHHGFDGDYEEMVAIFARGSHLRRWLLWRTADGITVQPLIGRNILCSDVTAAIEILGKPGGSD